MMTAAHKAQAGHTHFYYIGYKIFRILAYQSQSTAVSDLLLVKAWSSLLRLWTVFLAQLS